jgi:hypothetical protein
VLQGPFTSDSLKSWNTQGYLYPELECSDSADAQSFFPFSALSELWSLQEKLGLKLEDIQKLADAEVRLAKQPPTPLAQAVTLFETVNKPEVVDHLGPFTVAPEVHAVPELHAAPVDDKKLMAATDGNWDQPVGRRNQLQDPQVQPTAEAPNQTLASYDPIDDIIDEGPRRAAAAVPGERTLQPFAGMGAVAAPATVPAAGKAEPREAPQYNIRDVRPTGTQLAERAIPDAMEQLHISHVPAVRAQVGANTKVAPLALFGDQKAMQPSAAVQHAAPQVTAEPVNVKRIVPAQLFAQFTNAHDAQAPTNGHAPSDTMAMQQPQMKPPVPPPRAAIQTVAAPRPQWGASQPVQPAKFDDIQAEEIRKRKQEDAAAQAAAKTQMAQAEAERARRAAWAVQPKPVDFRQVIEDDEECAADLEGGWCAPLLFSHALHWAQKCFRVLLLVNMEPPGHNADYSMDLL